MIEFSGIHFIDDRIIIRKDIQDSEMLKYVISLFSMESYAR